MSTISANAVNTITYAHAVASVRNFADARQLALDTTARDTLIAARTAIVAAFDAIPDDDPTYALGRLAVQTMEFPRSSDGYPHVILPASTRDVFSAAFAAGLVGAHAVIGPVQMYSDMCAVEYYTRDYHALIDAARAAKRASDEYRRVQKHTTL